MKKKHKYILCDLSNLNEVKKNKTIFNGKRYDGLIHSAGDYLLSPIQLVNEKEIINSINTNLTAPYLITKEFCKRNNFNQDASIIFVSSVAGFVGSSSLSAYSMTKSVK